MNLLIQKIYQLRIWVRLVIAIWLMAACAGIGMVIWASHAQRDTAVEQAKDFAQSVHQMTLAGLTSMMITGTIAQRAVFLDQIKHATNVRMLHVVRGEGTVRQFGKGTMDESSVGTLEQSGLHDGKAVFKLDHDGKREVLKAVIPVIAQRNYLGKDCLGCHRVPEGSVLGVVTMEIDLDKMNAAVNAFRINVFWATVAISIPLILLIYFLLSRWVTQPLSDMTEGLKRVAKGKTDLSQRLEVNGKDEIADAAAAFNQVMEKAHDMVAAERISADVFDHALEGILVCDRNVCIVKVNHAFINTTGYSAQEAIGKNPRMLQSGQHDQAFYKAFWEAIVTTGKWQGDIWNKRKNGETYPAWVNISTVRNDDGEIEYYIAVFSDITVRKRQETLITFQAYHDALTGLPNRSLFKEQLDQALAVARRHEEQAVAVMFLDLDRFKFINDSLGHDIGDQLLKEVAARLRFSVREMDTVARMGGDEFTLLLPEIGDEKTAEAVAAKILEATKRPYRITEEDLFVTVSIGIALFPRDGRDGETLMKNADTAMYYVKDQGRAGYGFYMAELGNNALRHLQLDAELHDALQRREFELRYQPQLSLQTGKVIGAEVLLHWNHPRLGLIPAREFFSVAEEVGLSIPINEWVLQTACRDGMTWHQQQLAEPLHVSVKISQRQFYHEGLIALISETLQKSGLPASCLELEIAEGLAMQNVDHTVRIFAALAALGVRLTVSEFGMGFYSLLNELKRMPVNTIKIDPSFVRDLHIHPHYCSIVESMIKLSRGPELKVVAMGVEKEEQLESLRAIRCDHVQGQLFSATLSAEDIVDVLLQPPIVAQDQSGWRI